MNDNFKHSEITEKIIGEAYKVFNVLGSGFLEKVYARALCKKLRDAGFSIDEEYPIKVIFENEIIGDYFADIIVDNKVIVELKAVEILNKIHEVQLVNYLKATDLEVGLLLNFGEKIEIKRKVLTKNHKKSALSASGISSDKI